MAKMANHTRSQPPGSVRQPLAMGREPGEDVVAVDEQHDAERHAHRERRHRDEPV